MKFRLCKADDWCYNGEIEMNNLDDLLKFTLKTRCKRIVLEADYIKNSGFKWLIIDYNDYIE